MLTMTCLYACMDSQKLKKLCNCTDSQKLKICILNFIASLKIIKLLYEIILTLLQKMTNKKIFIANNCDTNISPYVIKVLILEPIVYTVQ